MKKEEAKVVRELMLALEILRSACENAKGSSTSDRQRLFHGQILASRVIYRNRHHVPDWQKDSYWDDVRTLTDDILFGADVQVRMPKEEDKSL